MPCFDKGSNMASSSALFDVLAASGSSQHDDALACRRCDSVGEHREQPGPGPHRAKLVCGDCGAFLRWLSLYSHAERVHRWEAFRRHVMTQQAPTTAQLAYLAALGDTRPVPLTRAEASERIESLLHARRGQS